MSYIGNKTTEILRDIYLLKTTNFQSISSLSRRVGISIGNFKHIADLLKKYNIIICKDDTLFSIKLDRNKLGEYIVNNSKELNKWEEFIHVINRGLAVT
jgi:hypothetical protein